MQLSQAGVSLYVMNRGSMWGVSDHIEWVMVRPNPVPESGNQLFPDRHQSINVRLSNTYSDRMPDKVDIMNHLRYI